MAARLHTCSPRRSTSAGGTTTTEYASARAVTWAYTRSRAAGVSSFESASSSISPRRPGGSSTAAATNGPAHAPRPASSAPATWVNPRRRSARSSAYSPPSARTTVRGGESITPPARASVGYRRHRLPRGVRHRIEGIRYGQRCRPPGRPEQQERPSDHVVHVDGRPVRVPGDPEAFQRVAGGAAVVTHHPQPPFRHLHLEGGRGGRVDDAVGRVEVRLVQGLAVDDQPPLRIAAHQMVTADRDHPLDEVFVPRVAAPLHRRFKHHDLTAARIPEVVHQFVDQDPVVEFERLLHRRRRYVERLQHEPTYQDRHQ